MLRAIILSTLTSLFITTLTSCSTTCDVKISDVDANVKNINIHNTCGNSEASCIEGEYPYGTPVKCVPKRELVFISCAKDRLNDFEDADDHDWWLTNNSKSGLDPSNRGITSIKYRIMNRYTKTDMGYSKYDINMLLDNCKEYADSNIRVSSARDETRILEPTLGILIIAAGIAAVPASYILVKENSRDSLEPMLAATITSLIIFPSTLILGGILVTGDY